METEKLLKKAKEKLEEIEKQQEIDKEKLNQLIEEKGNLEVDELVESFPERKQKVKKLAGEIKELTDTNEGYPPIIERLKEKIISLQVKVEEEIIEGAKVEQNELEKKMNILSQRMVPELKKLQEKNSQLKTHWSEWERLNGISGKGLGKRCLKPSYGMLDLIVRVLTDEWGGKSGLKIREFYGKQHYKSNCVIF